MSSKEKPSMPEERPLIPGSEGWDPRSSEELSRRLKVQIADAYEAKREAERVIDKPIVGDEREKRVSDLIKAGEQVGIESDNTVWREIVENSVDGRDIRVADIETALEVIGELERGSVDVERVKLILGRQNCSPEAVRYLVEFFYQPGGEQFFEGMDAAEIEEKWGNTGFN